MRSALASTNIETPIHEKIIILVQHTLACLVFATGDGQYTEILVRQLGQSGSIEKCIDKTILRLRFNRVSEMYTDLAKYRRQLDAKQIQLVRYFYVMWKI